MTVKQALADLLTSKKFLAAILSAVVWGLGYAGLDLTVDQLAPIVVPLWLYIMGQAFADVGKEKAKLEAKPKAKKGK